MCTKNWDRDYWNQFISYVCMLIELKRMGLRGSPEVPVPIFYRGQSVHEEGFRLDLLVEDTLIVELKWVEQVKPVHKKQLLTYLRLAKKPLGLLLISMKCY